MCERGIARNRLISLGGMARHPREAICDRNSPVSTEGFLGDSDSRRRLAPLVLGTVDEANDLCNELRIVTTGYEFLGAQVVIHVPLDNQI